MVRDATNVPDRRAARTGPPVRTGRRSFPRWVVWLVVILGIVSVLFGWVANVAWVLVVGLVLVLALIVYALASVAGAGEART